MRFFYTSNATRTYRAGKYQINFEPLIFSGGSWAGVFSTEDEDLAKALVEHGAPLREITQDEFETLKKTPKNNLLQLTSTLGEAKNEPEQTAEPVVEEDLSNVLNTGEADYADPLADEEVPKTGKKSKSKK